MEDEVITIPHIRLRWSDWTLWADLKIDARHGRGIRVPSGVSGVYEVKYADTDERLTNRKSIRPSNAHQAGIGKG